MDCHQRAGMMREADRSTTTPDFLARHGPPHRALERRAIATGTSGLRLRFYPGVRSDARSMLKRFAAWIRRNVTFRHPVRVTVVPHATVMGHDGAPGWAVFLIPSADYATGDVVRIFVGGGKVEVLETHYGYDTGQALETLVQDLAHEIVHYEQWRDGRAITERGVDRRAESLLRRFLASALPSLPRSQGSPPSGSHSRSR